MQDVNAEVNQGGKVITTMGRRQITNKCIIALVILVLIIIVLIILAAIFGPIIATLVKKAKEQQQ